MGLSRTVYEINGDFSRTSQKNFATPGIFPNKQVPLGIGYRRSRSKNKNDVATGPRNKFDDIFSRLDTIRKRDRRTDTGRQQKVQIPRLRIDLDLDLVPPVRLGALGSSELSPA